VQAALWPENTSRTLGTVDGFFGPRKHVASG
jgi:hypothetical protein